MKYKNKTNKTFSIAITAVMLLSVLVAMIPAMAMAATCEGVEEAQAQTSLAIDNPAAVYSAEEEREKEMQKVREMQLARLKQMPKQPGTLHAHVSENYYHSIGSDKLIKDWTPEVGIHLDLWDVEVDTVKVNLRLPAGIIPEYDRGYIPDEIYYDEGSGEFTVIYDTSEVEEGWVETHFLLPGLDPGFSPFVTVPVPNATPGYCAPFESKEVTLSLSPAVLSEVYDWGWVDLDVSNVASTEITSTTPDADDAWDGEWSAHAHWYYEDVSEFPEHTMVVDLSNNNYEVSTWYHCSVEKRTGTNIELIEVVTEPDITVDSHISTQVHADIGFDLDPTNDEMAHGFLEGIAVSETGEVLSGAKVGISGMGLHIEKITDENGKYSAMLPPWVYGTDARYSFVPYSDEYRSEYSEVFVSQDTTTTQNLTLYKAPTVKMKINPVDGDLTDDVISYEVTIENTDDETEHINLWGSDWAFDSTGYWFHEILKWEFSESHFDLAPGETRVVRADAKFAGAEPLDWGKYAFQIDCEPESVIISSPQNISIRGHYQLKDFFEVGGVFDVTVDADKEAYTIGETVKLGIALVSHGGPYKIDFKIDVEHLGDEWNYMVSPGKRYPADYTWTGAIPIVIPKSKLMPPGDYEFIVRITDSATGQLLGEGSDTVRIEHAKIMEKITIESFE